MTVRVLLELFAYLVLLAVAHTLLVGTPRRPGAADRAFAEAPAVPGDRVHRI